MSAIRVGRMRIWRPATGGIVPHQQGMYRIVDTATRKILYAGTGWLDDRLKHHIYYQKLDVAHHEYHYAEMREGATFEELRKRTEPAHIEKHAPPLNKNRGGGGGRPRIFTSAPSGNEAQPPSFFGRLFGRKR